MPMAPPLSHVHPRQRFKGLVRERRQPPPRRTFSCYARIRWRHAHMVAPGVVTARNAR